MGTLFASRNESIDARMQGFKVFFLLAAVLLAIACAAPVPSDAIVPETAASQDTTSALVQAGIKAESKTQFGGLFKAMGMDFGGGYGYDDKTEAPAPAPVGSAAGSAEFHVESKLALFQNLDIEGSVVKN